MKTRMWYALLGLFTVLILSGCGEKEEGIGRYGMLDESTPEYTTVKFLKSVYEDDNLDTAIQLSSGTERYLSSPLFAGAFDEQEEVQ